MPIPPIKRKVEILCGNKCLWALYISQGISIFLKFSSFN